VGLEYKVSLEDGVSAPARKGAASTKAMAEALGEAKLALSTYQAQLARVKLIGDIEGYHKYSAAVKEARQEVYHLTDALGPLKKESHSVGETLKSVAEGVGLERLGEMALETGKRILEGVVDALKEVAVTAFEVVDTNARLEASFEALGGAGAGKKTLAFVDDLAAKLPQSRKEIAGWVSQFQALGITDLSEIRQQILATASAQAITFASGGQGAEVYTKLAERIHVAVEEHKGLKLADKQLKQLYEAGLNVTDVARAYGRETKQAGYDANRLASELKAGTIDAQAFGNALSTTLVEKGHKPLEAMGDDIKVIGQKGLETFEHFFDGIDTSPLIEAFKSVVSLGDQGEVSGAILKQGITGALNEVIKWLAEGVTQAELFFLDLEVGAVKSGVGLKDVKEVLQETSDALKTAKSWAEAFYTVLEAVGHVSGKIYDDVSKFGSLPTVSGTLRGTSLGKEYEQAQGHADGGMVKQPASGEAFASVAPGEFILPRRIVDLLRQSDAGNDNAGGGSGAQIGELHVHIDAKEGVTNATELSASGIATALERFQIASGR
jgi:hypothetical protein